MRAPSADATRRSASRSTLSAWPRSFDTTHTVSSARCQRSWWAVSAADTLKRLWSRSLRLFSTRRLSLSEWDAARCSSQVITATTTVHAPFAALPHVVLETLERRDRAFVHLDAVADHAHPGRPRDHAGPHEATRDRSDLRDLERLPHLRLSQHHFLLLGGEQTLHRRPHILYRLVDDAVRADLHLFTIRRGAGVRVGPHVEANDNRVRGLGEQHVPVGDRAHAAMHDLHLHLGRGELSQGVRERFRGAALVGLDDDPQRRDAARGALRHEVLERLHTAGAPVLRLSLQTLALLGDVACRPRFRHDAERVARLGHALEPEHL